VKLPTRISKVEFKRRRTNDESKIRFKTSHGWNCTVEVPICTVCKLYMNIYTCVYIYHQNSSRGGEMSVGGGNGNGVGGGRYNSLMFGTVQSISMQNNRCADTRP